ncbi:TetR/AcrR family transcriptional regulator [Ornithinimicrobium cavernae]|uniref:TetR/AcrR family transcriptional regulator n=1 Tax=Ornithinimicrobium cavernae TaxID=2666047 RepID=UPI001F463FDE|nr:TetR family transcriptional regulator [Ornithinimicrobium cavernae]
MQPSVSLRERKRTDTFRSIHDAAADLVLDHGLARVTVDEIAERAGVSQRTFFNYFPTKEDAVLGVHAPERTERALAAFRDDSDRDLFSRVVELFAQTMRSSIVPSDDPSRRRRLTTEHPELKHRFMIRVADTERLAMQVIEEHPEALPNTPEAARVLVYLAGAVVRFTFATTPGAISGNDDETLDRAIATFREVLRSAL